MKSACSLTIRIEILPCCIEDQTDYRMKTDSRIAWLPAYPGSWRDRLDVRDLREARDERTLRLMQQRLQRVELLVIDELGFVPFDRVGGELLFNVFADRYERRSTLITTNLAKVCCGCLSFGSNVRVKDVGLQRMLSSIRTTFRSNSGKSLEEGR